ncbi:MAG: DUF4465 domain-containing protein [Dysgonamonadaceae bacterium]|jgi:hypothetical protein|nr:DUF4465 domain-containing protein [Dysgonamonadaceae bacterium]
MNKTKTMILAAMLIIAGKICSEEIITLDLSSPTHPSVIEIDDEKGCWTETYNTEDAYRTIKFGIFDLNHIPGGFGGTDVGGGMSYWDGFTISVNGDSNDYGEPGMSDGWLPHQWGCMAGGGIKTDDNGNPITDQSGKISVEKGIPYLVAYWGYYMEMFGDGEPCLQINFNDGNMYMPLGIYINNHPWPYYGNIHGDGFAGKFDSEGDFFKLTVHGLNEVGEDTGISVEHILAEFKNGELHQNPDWQYVDISSLGAVNGIYFTMETSNEDPVYGPNTAVYFCLDKLSVKSLTDDHIPSRPTGLLADAHESGFNISWNPSTSADGVKGYNVYLGNNSPIFTTNTNYSFQNLNPYTSYKVSVEAISNNDFNSPKASVTVKTTDETPPTIPENLSGETTKYTMTLAWNPSTDNVKVTEYHIFLNGERQKRVSITQCTLTGLDPETSYIVEVEARDDAGNKSEKASIILSTTNGTIIQNLNNIQEKPTKIYNLYGAEVNNQNISNLPKGIYILKYKNIARKIIIQ